MKSIFASGNRKGSLEVGINFIVVMIVCIALLMMGLYLLTRGQSAFEDEYDKIKAIRESQVREALSKSGEPVMIYPNNVQVERGDGYIFSLGITNQRGADEDFYVYVVEGTVNNLGNEILYTRNNPPTRVKNTETGFVPIKITAAKDQGRLSYTFNVCVYPASENPGYGCPQEGMYGNLQKIILNVR